MSGKALLEKGHALKTHGQIAEAIAAYRGAYKTRPGWGEAYWSLANLKTYRFTPTEVASMRQALARARLADQDRVHLDFALGKATEDGADFAAAFAHYAAANALHRQSLRYDSQRVHDHVRRSIALFSTAFFAQRRGWGAPTHAPIFIVGLPRAGSTLIEQILASHSQVEGTFELPDLLAIAKRLGGRKAGSGATGYPERLQELGRPEIVALGEEYLERTQVHRGLRRRFFTDKTPNNFAHIGLIHLILPQARIIDARRGAAATCVSCYKQHFSRGQAFTYDLTDMGRYYRDYAALMAHFDAVLPGRVHRVSYESLVSTPEAQIRQLLAFCGLPFEASCLAFHATERPVHTPSSQQVRQPIFTDGVDQWRNFEPWLGPLRAVLRGCPSSEKGLS